MQTVKLHWNLIDKKWKLIEIGTEIPKGSYGRSYVIPAEAHFIDPRKSILVRLAWRVHLFFKKYMPKKIEKQNAELKAFTNISLGEKWD